VAEKPSCEVEASVALGGGAVADADDLELLAEPVGHADDHVVDERADQAVQRPVLRSSSGRSTRRVSPSWRTVMAPGIVTLERRPWGP
jgi:hypothetical protein